jgi:hypothetical protein
VDNNDWAELVWLEQQVYGESGCDRCLNVLFICGFGLLKALEVTMLLCWGCVTVRMCVKGESLCDWSGCLDASQVYASDKMRSQGGRNTRRIMEWNIAFKQSHYHLILSLKRRMYANNIMLM